MNKIDFDKAYDKFGFIFNEFEDFFEVKKSFQLLSKASISSMFFMLISIIMMFLVFLEGNMATIIIGGILFGAVFLFSLLSLIKSATDLLHVSQNEIFIKYNLKKRKWSDLEENEIILESWKEVFKMRRAPYKDTELRLVRIHITQKGLNKKTILNIETKEENADIAIRFANDIKNRIIKRIKN